MSLLTDLSGVNAAQTDIDTIGNNIANVDTSGFKTSAAQFSSLYGSALSATPGQGVSTSDLAQSFGEGTISQTGNPLDAAINGNGFFQLQSGSGIVYSRDGSFQISSSGQLVNASGDQVMGFAPTASGAAASASGALQPIQINQANIAPGGDQQFDDGCQSAVLGRADQHHHHPVQPHQPAELQRKHDHDRIRQSRVKPVADDLLYPGRRFRFAKSMADQLAVDEPEWHCDRFGRRPDLEL